MIVDEESYEMLTVNYSFPSPFDLSSVTYGREKGWIVWVCQKVGPNDYRHYGRGQHKDLTEAARLAMLESDKHRRALEHLEAALAILPDQELKELF